MPDTPRPSTARTANGSDLARHHAGDPAPIDAPDVAARKRLIRDTSAPIEDRRAAFREHNRAMDPETYPAPPADVEAACAVLDSFGIDYETDREDLWRSPAALQDVAEAFSMLAAIEAANVPPIDHERRGFLLRALVADAYKFNAESLDEIAATLADVLKPERDEPVEVPFRYACLQHDGRGSWVVTGNTLDEIRSTLLDGLVAEYPWTPGEGLDLDTGRRLDARVKVTVEVTDELTPVVPQHRGEVDA